MLRGRVAGRLQQLGLARQSRRPARMAAAFAHVKSGRRAGSNVVAVVVVQQSSQAAPAAQHSAADGPTGQSATLARLVLQVGQSDGR